MIDAGRSVGVALMRLKVKFILHFIKLTLFQYGFDTISFSVNTKYLEHFFNSEVNSSSNEDWYCVFTQ